MINIKNLSCKYGKEKILNDISFDVFKNEKISIFGQNGCGKTTLLKAICGLVEYDGNIFVDQKDIKTISRKDIAKYIGMMSQISSYFFSYSVFDTVMMGRYVHSKGSAFSLYNQKDKDIVIDCLKNTGIYNIKDKNITELSGGQIQRVFLARLIAQEPKVILLDEPTNHLDIGFQLELMDFLSKWVLSGERCIISVFHDINMGLNFGDKALLLDNGKVVCFDNVENINLDAIGNIYNADIKGYMKNSLERWNNNV